MVAASAPPSSLRHGDGALAGGAARGVGVADRRAVVGLPGIIHVCQVARIEQQSVSAFSISRSHKEHKMDCRFIHGAGQRSP